MVANGLVYQLEASKLDKYLLVYVLTRCTWMLK